jgi:imidazolonepropionase-like amidohydrolase
MGRTAVITYVQCGLLFDGRVDEPIQHATLVLEGELVREVLGGWRGSESDNALDLKALAVLPGLVDGHDHFGIDMGDGEPEAMQDPQWRAIKGVKNARAMLASGITTLRNAGEKHGLGFQIRRAIELGWIPGPRVVLSGTPISSTGGHGWFVGVEADGPDAVRAAVRQNVKDGADMIKMIVTGGVTTPGGTLIRVCFTEPEIRAAVEETHLAGKRIGVHCYGGPAATWAIEAGVDSIEHGTYLTDEQLDAMVERGTRLVCTSSVMRAAGASPQVVGFMRDRFRQVSEDYVALMARVRERAIPVAIGCDTHHASMAEELQTLLEAGYSSAQALRAATFGGATLCGWEDRVGTLEPGKLADFIAVEGDLMADPSVALTRVRAVFKGGSRQPI